MAKEEAKTEQEQLAKYYILGWWYATNCRKCCEVYPKLEKEGPPAFEMVFYRCPVCGRRTNSYKMPWLAADAWSNEDIMAYQVKIF